LSFEIFIHAFEEQVSKAPNNIAVINKKLTYVKLNELANQLAYKIIKLTHKKSEDLVLLYLDRDENIIIGILAILKAGKAYVPIDPNYPFERIKYIVEDTRSLCIITVSKYRPILLDIIDDIILTSDNKASRNINLIIIDDELNIKKPSLNVKVNLASIIEPNNLMYVLYTSGTTGTPKGVMIAHNSFMALLNDIKNIFFECKDKITTYSLTNYSFDIFGLEYGIPLMTGGSIHIGNKDFISLECSKFDFLQMTPSLCYVKINYLKNIKNTILFIGGEKLKSNLLKKILGKPLDVAHFYGPTETTIWSTFKYYSCQNIIDLSNIYIGKPLPSEKVYVLDRKLLPVAIGEVGEIYIAGAGIAKGYLNKSDLTSSKFIANPFQNKTEKKLGINNLIYQTGDLGRWSPQGELEFIGRHDSQIKLRGHRIELGEIENAIISYEGVIHSIVIIDNFSNNYDEYSENARLIGYYCADKRLDEDEMYRHLKTKLPSYMIPNILIHLRDIPLNTNGKVDVYALPQPNVINSLNYFEPNSKIEADIKLVMSDLLKINEDQIGTYDDFFKLGGNSILAILLLATLREKYKIYATLEFFIQEPTVHGLANLQESSNKKFGKKIEECIFKKHSKWNQALLPRQEIITGNVPLIANRYTYFFRRERNLTYWNIVRIFKFKNTLDKEALFISTRKLIQHHDGLRLQIVKKASYWRQFIVGANQANPLIEILYNSAVENKSLELFIKQKINEMQETFTFPGELFKIVHISDAQNRSFIVFIVHHLLADDYSMQIIINDFFSLYRQYTVTGKACLPPKTTSFLDFSTYSKHYWISQKEQLLTYWSSLPWIKVKKLVPDYEFSHHLNIEKYTFYDKKSIQVKEIQNILEKTNNYRFVTYLLCAIGIAYYKWTKHDILNLAVVLLGRENFLKGVDLSRTVGWISETVPILLQPNQPIEEYLKNTESQLKTAITQGKGLGIMQHLTNSIPIKSKIGDLPIPEISLNILLPNQNNDYLDDIATIVSEFQLIENRDDTQRGFLISGGAYFNKNKFYLSWDYSLKLFRKTSIDIFNKDCFLALKNLIKVIL
jgi:amino acid adenylation domain-containing protein